MHKLLVMLAVTVILGSGSVMYGASKSSGWLQGSGGKALTFDEIESKKKADMQVKVQKEVEDLTRKAAEAEKAGKKELSDAYRDLASKKQSLVAATDSQTRSDLNKAIKSLEAEVKKQEAGK